MMRSAAPTRSVSVGASPRQRFPPNFAVPKRRFSELCSPRPARPFQNLQHARLEVLRSAATESATTTATVEESLAQRLRLGKLEPDGLSYKESFIVRSYEVGVNKTATVETIANLLQV